MRASSHCSITAICLLDWPGFTYSSSAVCPFLFSQFCFAFYFISSHVFVYFSSVCLDDDIVSSIHRFFRCAFGLKMCVYVFDLSTSPYFVGIFADSFRNFRSSISGEYFFPLIYI